MLKILSAIVITAVLTVLGGCSTLKDMVGSEDGLALLEKAADGVEKVEDATLGNAAKALPKYCKVPGMARSLFRDRVNDRAEAEGAKVGVWCPGDPPLKLGAVSKTSGSPITTHLADIGRLDPGLE